MRRLLAILAVLAGGAVVALALGAGGGGGRSGSYRVDAIFDNASFLISGQDVRIAGANVGSVTDVTVTPDNRARVSMEVDGRFGPFRSDADCFIAPQSLIGERFVQCAPGSPRGTELRPRDGHAPTIPLANTHSPVDPDLILDSARLPTRERLTIILNELGAGLAGNGERLNGAIRRAAPALQATDRVLRIVDRDRAVLGRLIDRSDVVVGELAKRRDRVGAFIDEADRVASTAAQRRGAVAEGVQRLPATLRATRSSLAALRGLADRSRPLLGALDASAAPLTHLVTSVPPLAKAARPAILRLGAMSRVGQATLRDGGPVVEQLRTFSHLAVPAGTLVRELTTSLQATGGTEGLQSFLYNIAIALARFDGSSHILPSYVVAPPECIPFSEITIPTCDGHFVTGPQTSTPALGAPAAKRSIDTKALDYLLGK